MTGTPVSAPAASAATAEACEDDDGEPLVGAQRLWRQYAFHGQGRCRLWRVGLVALAYYAAGFCLMMMFGFPTVPAHGLPARQFDTFVTLGVSVPLLIFLSFYVIDATLLNRHFIQYLASARTRWPKAAFAQCRAHGMQKEDLPEYLDVKMIAHRTRVVGKLVYYPFVILFLMIVSRSSYFDDWDWPVALIILLGVNAVIAVVSAYMLRSAAERARSSALEHLRERLLRHTLNHREDEADAVREIIREVEAERGGAFSLLSQYPIVAAILLPSGGVGVWFLLDYLAKTLR